MLILPLRLASESVLKIQNCTVTVTNAWLNVLLDYMHKMWQGHVCLFAQIKVLPIMPAGRTLLQGDALPDAHLLAIPIRTPPIIPVLIFVPTISMPPSQTKLAWLDAHLAVLLIILPLPAWINVLQANGPTFCCESVCQTVLITVACLLMILLPPVWQIVPLILIFSHKTPLINVS